MQINQLYNEENILVPPIEKQISNNIHKSRLEITTLSSILQFDYIHMRTASSKKGGMQIEIS